MIREAVALGRPELIGLSIDIYGTWQPRTENVGTGRQRGATTQSSTQRNGNASSAGTAHHSKR